MGKLFQFLSEIFDRIPSCGRVMISMTGFTALTLSKDSNRNFRISFDRTVFSSIKANFWPMQFLGPAENGT